MKAEKQQENKINVSLKERKYVDVSIKIKAYMSHYPKVKKGRGLIKIMSCFKTWPPKGSTEKIELVQITEDERKKIANILA